MGRRKVLTYCILIGAILLLIGVIIAIIAIIIRVLIPPGSGSSSGIFLIDLKIGSASGSTVFMNKLELILKKLKK
jgi:preprotein translocase subunit SecG